MWVRLAEYFRTALKQVGIEVTLESTDTGGWASRRMSRLGLRHDDQLPCISTVTRRSAWSATYVSTNILKTVFSNTGGYSNPKVDELFTQARTAAEPAEAAGGVQ